MALRGSPPVLRSRGLPPPPPPTPNSSKIKNTKSFLHTILVQNKGNSDPLAQKRTNLPHPTPKATDINSEITFRKFHHPKQMSQYNH